MSELDKLIAKWEKQFEYYVLINHQEANLIGKFLRDLKKLKEE